MIQKGKQKYGTRRKTCTNAALSTINPKRTGLGSNPRLTNVSRNKSTQMQVPDLQIMYRYVKFTLCSHRIIVM
jgi:hypothetical protein